MSRNLKVAKRFFWKEYRFQRSLWIILLACSTIARFLYELARLSQSNVSIAEHTYAGCLVIPIIFAIISGALLFATETDDHTKSFLDSFGYMPRSIALGKIGFSLLATLSFFIASCLIVISGIAVDPQMPIRVSGLGNVLITVLSINLISSTISLFLRNAFPAILLATIASLVYVSINTLLQNLIYYQGLQNAQANSRLFLDFTLLDLTCALTAWILVSCVTWYRLPRWVQGQYEIIRFLPEISIKTRKTGDRAARSRRLARWSLNRQTQASRLFWMTAWKEWQSIKLLTAIVIVVILIKFVWMGFAIFLPSFQPRDTWDFVLKIFGLSTLPPAVTHITGELPVVFRRIWESVPTNASPAIYFLFNITLGIPLLLVIWICGLQFAADDFKNRAIQLQTNFGANSLVVFLAKLLTRSVPILLCLIAIICQSALINSLQISPYHGSQTINPVVSSILFDFEIKHFKPLLQLATYYTCLTALLIYGVSICLSMTFRSTLLRHAIGIITTLLAYGYTLFAAFIFQPVALTFTPLLLTLGIVGWWLFHARFNELPFRKSFSVQLATPCVLILTMYFTTCYWRATEIPRFSFEDSINSGTIIDTGTRRIVSEKWRALEVSLRNQQQANNPQLIPEVIANAERLANYISEQKYFSVDPESIGIEDPQRILRWLTEQLDRTTGRFQEASSTQPNTHLQTIAADLYTEEQIKEIWKILSPAIVINDYINRFYFYPPQEDGRNQLNTKLFRITEQCLQQDACPLEIYDEYLDLPYDPSIKSSYARYRLEKTQAAISGNWYTQPLSSEVRIAATNLPDLSMNRWLSPLFFAERIRASRVANLEYITALAELPYIPDHIHQGLFIALNRISDLNPSLQNNLSYHFYRTDPRGELMIYAALQAQRIDVGRFPDELSEVLEDLPAAFNVRQFNEFKYSPEGVSLPILIGSEENGQLIPVNSPFLFKRLHGHYELVKGRYRLLEDEFGLSFISQEPEANGLYRRVFSPPIPRSKSSEPIGDESSDDAANQGMLSMGLDQSFLNDSSMDLTTMGQDLPEMAAMTPAKPESSENSAIPEQEIRTPPTFVSASDGIQTDYYVWKFNSFYFDNVSLNDDQTRGVDRETYIRRLDEQGRDPLYKAKPQSIYLSR